MDIEDARRELNVARRWLRERNLERDAIIDALCACYIAREHVLLLGPPGTGKSRLAMDFAEVTGIPDTDRFGILLDRFTSKDEMFGPVKLSGLVERDEYGRKLRGLAASRFVFADEIFKASSAILNAMLTAINERLFDNDGVRVKIPLEMVVGASNEMPEDETLGALWDRFIARFVVAEISDASLVTLLSNRGPRNAAPVISRAAIDTLRAAAQVIVESPAPGIVAAITIMRSKRSLSARRAVKLRALIAGYLAMGLSPEDAISSCGHALWDDPGAIAEAKAIALGSVAQYRAATQAAATGAPSPLPPPPPVPAPAPAPRPPAGGLSLEAQRDTWKRLRGQVQLANAANAGLIKVEIAQLRGAGYLNGTALRDRNLIVDGRETGTWEDLLAQLERRGL